jgi:type VI secretion system secreted protein Hcp
MRQNKQRRSVRHDLVALTIAAAAAAISINASADIFAKLGDIKGESIDEKHADQIEALQWSWGVTGPQRKTPACPHEFTIDKFVDAASPFLVAAAAKGAVLADATVSVRKSGKPPQDYLVMTFKEVVISGIGSRGTAGSNSVSESISFNYSSATISYSPQKADGSLGPALTATVGPSCPSP